MTHEAATEAAVTNERLRDMLDGGPAMELVSLNTQFVAAGGGADAAADPMADPFATPGFGNAPGTGGSATPAGARDKSHVRVTGTFRVAAPNLERFMLDTVEPALKERLQRDGLPYTIVYAQVPWTASGANDPNSPGTFADPRGRGGSTGFSGFQDRPDRRPGGFQQPGTVGGDPKQLAPLPGAPAERPGVQTVTITWYAVLPAASEGGDA
jgi:hypothetical protein